MRQQICWLMEESVRTTTKHTCSSCKADKSDHEGDWVGPRWVCNECWRRAHV